MFTKIIIFNQNSIFSSIYLFLFYRTYGTDISMRKRQKIRSESFESNSECNNRLLKNTKVKKHGSAVSWNSKECLNEVQMYDSEVKFINFTGLAKKYDMKNKEGNIPGNGGQVVKEFLIENGIDLSSFNYKSKDRNNENTRRCKRKI